MKNAITIAAVAALSACAPSAKSVAPVSMGDAYAGITCQDAASRLTSERTTLAALEKKQNSAAAGDAFGVFLIGVPTSSVFGGNVAGDLAASKGKVAAYEARLASCTTVTR